MKTLSAELIRKTLYPMSGPRLQTMCLCFSFSRLHGIMRSQICSPCCLLSFSTSRLSIDMTFCCMTIRNECITHTCALSTLTLVLCAIVISRTSLSTERETSPRYLNISQSVIELTDTRANRSHLVARWRKRRDEWRSTRGRTNGIYSGELFSRSRFGFSSLLAGDVWWMNQSCG